MDAASLVLDQGYSIAEAARSLNVGRTRTFSLIEQVSERETVKMLCGLFDVASSCYYEFKQRKPDAYCIRLASRVKEFFNMSRGAAGSRALVSMLRSEGLEVGRFKVRKFMQEAGMTS